MPAIMSGVKKGVLLVLPKFDGAKGGLYTLAHNFINQLRIYNIPVSCVLGLPKAELGNQEKDYAKKKQLTILEPGLLTEGDEPESPEERLKQTELYDHVLPLMNQFAVMIPFGTPALILASHFKREGQRSSECDLYVINTCPNVETDDSMEAILTSETAEVAKCIFSVGYRSWRRLNTEIRALPDDNTFFNQILIPDFVNLMSPGYQGMASGNSTQKQIFVPYHGRSDQDFIMACICAVNRCNETFQKVNKLDSITELIIQVPEGYQRDFTKCEFNSHSHKYFKLVSYSSLEEVLHAARRSSLIIAGGRLADSGFSGLEFLMNHFPVLVPEETDVAEILKKAAPQFAETFLLKSVGANGESITLSDQKICSAIEGTKPTQEVISLLLKDVFRHSDFMGGKEILLKSFVSIISQNKSTESSTDASTEDQQTVSIAQALAQEFRQQKFCSFNATVLRVGEMIKASEKVKYSTCDVLLADGDNFCVVKVFKEAVQRSLRQGKTYRFRNLLRKYGDLPFWIVRESSASQMKSQDVPVHIMELGNLCFDKAKFTSHEARSLREALDSPATSSVKGKIVNVSSLKLTKGGKGKRRLLALKDRADEPAVKVAVFSDQASSRYNVGDCVELTSVYRDTKYDTSLKLSTKKDNVIKPLSGDGFEAITIAGDCLENDSDFKERPDDFVSDFTITGITSINLYPCCTKKACMRVKMKNNSCPKCEGTTETKDYCGKFLVEAAGEEKEYTIFSVDIQKLVSVEPAKAFEHGVDLQDALVELLPMKGRGIFREDKLTLVSD